MLAVSAPIPAFSFVITWKAPFSMFNSLGHFALQPLPSHVLRAIWDERNMERFANHPYWRDESFQVGPFRPFRFEPQVESRGRVSVLAAEDTLRMLAGERPRHLVNPEAWDAFTMRFSGKKKTA